MTQHSQTQHSHYQDLTPRQQEILVDLGIDWAAFISGKERFYKQKSLLNEAKREMDRIHKNFITHMVNAHTDPDHSIAVRRIATHLSRTFPTNHPSQSTLQYHVTKYRGEDDGQQ